MFDLAGLKAMGESIEQFTKETHASLIDIGMQIRIGNALAAIALARLQPDVERPTAQDYINLAMEVASASPDLPQPGEGTPK